MIPNAHRRALPTLPARRLRPTNTVPRPHSASARQQVEGARLLLLDAMVGLAAHIRSLVVSRRPIRPAAVGELGQTLPAARDPYLAVYAIGGLEHGLLLHP